MMRFSIPPTPPVSTAVLSVPRYFLHFRSLVSLIVGVGSLLEVLVAVVSLIAVVGSLLEVLVAVVSERKGEAL